MIAKRMHCDLGGLPEDHDGGWRLVEVVARRNKGDRLVRDVHRGEYFVVSKSSLKRIVPRSEWETDG